MLDGVLIVLGLMLLNGVFAGAEIAVLSVRKTRLVELADERRPGARAVQWLRHRPERFLATVQIGITVVGTAAAAIGGESLAHDIARRLEGVPGVGRWAPSVGLAAVIVGISVLEIVVGELVPKSLALRAAERYALTVGPALRHMATLVRPAAWLLTGMSNAVLRLFGDRTSFSEARLSPEEIRELVEEAGRVGSIDAKTTEIASRALDFRELYATDVMAPRTAIAAVPKDATREQLRAALAEAHLDRLAVYEGSTENYVGYVTVREVLREVLARAPDPVAKVVRPMRFVPETARAVDLLRQLQSERAPLAMVVDENGSVTGLITLEDLLEELVGDILGEQDAPPPSLAREADGTAVVPGHLPVREVNRALGLELPEPEGFTTIAGLCLELAERIPDVGAKLTASDGSVLEVLDASPRKVRLVRVHPATRAEEGEDPP